MNIDIYLQRQQNRIETALRRWLPSETTAPQRLHKAMRYAMLNGGKRIRPLLVYATGEVFGVPLSQLDAPAASVECIHTYSLIHDDLPIMDDDDFRREQPSCHRAFDEATALLAGDALQALAFQLLACNDAKLDPKQHIQMLRLLSEACGHLGMVGGQALETEQLGHHLTTSQLNAIHRKKTGALIQASVCLGALAADTDVVSYKRLEQYGECIGLAFQIQDDILDHKGPQALQEQAEAPSYTDVMTIEQAKTEVQRLYSKANELLEHFDARAISLRELTKFLLKREF